MLHVAELKGKVDPFPFVTKKISPIETGETIVKNACRQDLSLCCQMNGGSCNFSP